LVGQWRIEQVHDLDGEALRLERGGETAEALRLAARHTFAVTRGQHDATAPPAYGLQDPARQLILGLGRDDEPPALILDHGSAVLRDPISARALRIAVEVEQLEADEGILGAHAVQQTGEGLALPAAMEYGQVERLLHLGEHFPRD